jgi:membrane protease YdiL (CAAX protease family)
MLSAKPWTLPGLMRLVPCMMFCFAFMVLVTMCVEHVTGAKPEDNSPPVLILSTLALDGSILVGVFLFLRFERITWSDAFGFKSPGLWRALFWGLIVAVVFTPIGQEMNNLCGRVIEWFHMQPQSEEAVETLQKATPGFSRVYLVFFALVIAPVAEETLFRGILYPAIRQYGFPRFALWGSSILFAAIHLNLPAFLPLTIFAVILAVLYEKTDNLLACIVAHSVFNAAGVVLLYSLAPTAPPHH